MGGDGGGSTATPSQYANQPVGEDSVTFGFPIALSGPFGSDGERQERGSGSRSITSTRAVGGSTAGSSRR
ncbi:hypothetical protein ACFQL1_10890 [Halomicroarcula sp. GCM10025709]|uniref:hypothetical protein n=1 Tax=Halomicroarcula sp. GCM10025709 TaxID=3252669 RepID=UPI003623533E